MVTDFTYQIELVPNPAVGKSEESPRTMQTPKAFPSTLWAPGPPPLPSGKWVLYFLMYLRVLLTTR